MLLGLIRVLSALYLPRLKQVKPPWAWARLMDIRCIVVTSLARALLVKLKRNQLCVKTFSQTISLC